MARENFIKFKEPMETKIEYFCCDDKEFFPKDSEVVLYEYNRWKDVNDNPTSKLEKEFLERGAMVGTDSESSMVFLGKVKIKGKWEEHILTDFEVPYELITGYVVFWEIRPAQKYRWIKLDKNGKPRFGEEQETSWTPTLEGLGYTEYDWFGKEIYEDNESIDNLIKGEVGDILPRELEDEEKLQLAIKGWLEIYGHPYLTIGEPPKEIKKGEQMKNMKSKYAFIKRALQQDEGVSFFGMGQCNNGETLYLVISKINGEYQAKLAFNADDLQCDYDVDWVMPYAENGDVYDTDTTIDDNPDLFDWEYWLGEAETIKSLVNQGEIKTGK